MSRRRSELFLVLAALIWGCAMVAQSVGMQYVGPWTFNCVRSWIGGLTLLVMMPLLDRIRGFYDTRPAYDRKVLWQGGLVCGVILAAASFTQQYALQFMSVGKAGFLAALYVIIVPLIAVLLGRKISASVMIASLLAVAGLYLLSFASAEGFVVQDLIMILSALLYAFHILAISNYSPKTDGVRLACIHFLVAGAVCTGPMLYYETVSWDLLIGAAPTILYAGVISSGIGYTFQIIGQKHTDAATASLLMSLESVFAALAGFVILHQILSLREICGCALVFAGIILAQKKEK